MNVLLVDDEQKFALMLAKRLGLRGIHTDVFFSGEEALRRVEDGQSYAVGLLDVKMPGIGGIELGRQLKTLDPEMKIVFLTGHGSDVDYQVGASEADGYLPKPLKIEDLIEILNQLTEAD
ncbi:response regulator [Desulfosarcina ovata]|uniref:Response regulator n=1 Tax=Desulfosarcina ovata subsp. ovata TaxID=2752305 RepID=A0A5K8AKL3_9BACT|nr:response regulator [Desulfosarcina ovata]BBO93252.1 response regulator [Desulfosarcina ovata subsp. ovata]